MILCGEYHCKNRILKRSLMRIVFFYLTVLIISLNSCASNQKSDEIKKEIKEGNIHLVLNERTANFSLFYLTERRYEPLFNNKDITASFTTISVNGKFHKLNDRIFSKNIQMIEGYPAFKFESRELSVFQMFTPASTSASGEANGVIITYIITNISDNDLNAGLRLLLDTDLGEGRGSTPFKLSSKEVTSETRIEGDSGEKFWISGNDNVSLMGSVIDPFDNTSKTPDYVHFASWKRFYDAPWSFNYSAGRTFNSDSAVCYFYEPSLLKKDESFIYSIFLSIQDIQWYNTGHPEDSFMESHHTAIEHLIETVAESHHTDNTRPAASVEEPALSSYDVPHSGEDTDIVVLQMLQSLLHQFITGEIDLSEQDLLEIENAMIRYR